ncbi:N-methyl-L-tryptophan oxidase [Cytophagales bacterium WSM2-2]|nr:N-methyl-L-tryptophan oxidase [Cytophagales bacterium WSM2-2]
MANTNTFAPASIRIDTAGIGLPKNSKVVVVGAGAFGGWTSLYLLRSGYRVTLIDAWGPGNSRSSSGDETRVIRSTYGDNEFYFSLNVRALELWKENQQQWNKQLFFNTGVIWFCYQEKSPLVDDSIPFSKKYNMEYEYLDRKDIKKKYPVVNVDDLHHAWFDPYGGFLKARESCQAVNEAFVREGGTFIQAYAKPGTTSPSGIDCVSLSNGEKISADIYLFACGPWLGQLFPEVLGGKITCTKQEAYYFGVPQVQSVAFDKMPVWIDLDGHDFYYGIPGNSHRGFKIGVDLRGEVFDPTLGERTYNPDTLLHARKFIGHRFPDLKNAPVVESRVCPYENSPDGNFIFEQHPHIKNTWFLGGGSGHGFKHGPALGEMVSRAFSM